MIKSIQHFQTEGVKNLEKVFIDYSKDLAKVAEMVEGVTKSVVELGLSMIAEEWEFYDELLRTRKNLRPDYEIIRRDQVSKLTSLGEVVYHKTYFRNKVTGERCYLLDRLMGFASHERLTEDAVARILEEAAESSYEKGGNHASISGVGVSKETVMDKLHSLEFPPTAPLQEKKRVQVLYVDADEDHVALQYIDKDGERQEGRGHTYMPKLVYVYEGVDTEDKRHKLVGVKYFGGGYEGTKETAQLWKEVMEYIDGSYEEEVLERIYINGDGAEWIKAGVGMHRKARFVLDKYHLHQYIVSATSHLMDSKQDARRRIWKGIHGKKKQEVEKAFDKILSVTESGTRRDAVERSKKYILGNWTAIMNKVKNQEDRIQCSAEGHISHIYSSRLSSRPLGWSETGADKMSRLRVYKKNGGNMLELVRFQQLKLPKAAGAEEVIYSASEMLEMESRNRARLGKLAGMRTYSIPYPQIKKIANFKDHIYGL